MSNSQKTYSNYDVKEILTQLGYNLIDVGDSYRCAANYRNGKNPNSLKIYKGSGVFKDFGMDDSNLPFGVLISRITGNESESKKILKSSSQDNGEIKLRKEILLKEEKTFNESSLKRLLPYTDFYKGRGISEKTQKFYKFGLATEKRFYQRLVFPIFRSDGKIHGFSGRMTKKNPKTTDIKWLHSGQKANWVYPAYIKDEKLEFKILDNIEKESSVIIVESIGDSMALFENEIYNSIVSFGLYISPKIIAALSLFDLDRYIISFNNDSNKIDRENNGKINSFINAIRLASCVDFKKIFVVLPKDGDWGDYHANNKGIEREKFENLDHKESCETIIEFLNKNKRNLKAWNKANEEYLNSFTKKYEFEYN